MILNEARGEVDPQIFRDDLVQRARRLNLEYDIAWANKFFIDHLLAVFPNATFMVLVRDPYTWLQAMVGNMISRRISSRRLILRSHEIGRSHQRIAEFYRFPKIPLMSGWGISIEVPGAVDSTPW